MSEAAADARSVRVHIQPTRDGRVRFQVEKWRWNSRVGIGNPRIIVDITVAPEQLSWVVQDHAALIARSLRELGPLVTN